MFGDIFSRLAGAAGLLNRLGLPTPPLQPPNSRGGCPPEPPPLISPTSFDASMSSPCPERMARACSDTTDARECARACALPVQTTIRPDCTTPTPQGLCAAPPAAADWLDPPDPELAWPLQR